MALVMSMPAYSQNCSEAVDKICKSFDSMTAQMSKCKNTQDVDLLNMDIVVEESGLDNISDDCQSYVLTADDKAKLNEAFDKFMDVSASKTYELCGGAITKTQIARELEPLRKSWSEGLSGAATLGDFVEVMESL